jgi:hypothetical protein
MTLPIHSPEIMYQTKMTKCFSMWPMLTTVMITIIEGQSDINGTNVWPVHDISMLPMLTQWVEEKCRSPSMCLKFYKQTKWLV